MHRATGWAGRAIVALCLTVLFTAPGLAGFPYVVGSGWQLVDFDILTPAPFGGGYGGTIDDTNDPNSPVNAPWDFNLTSASWLRITDVGDMGDYFRIWDQGTEIGVTNQVPFVMSDPNNPPDEFDPDYTYGDPAFSHGLFLLDAGFHSLNFQDVVFESGSFDNLPEWFEGVGEAGFRVDPVPEPGALAFLSFGLALMGLGVVRRR